MRSPDVKSVNDEALAARARTGCRTSFSTIYQRHQAKVYRFALQMSANPAMAEEATQEVFLTLLSDGGGFDPSKGSLIPYLMGIARNQTYRLMRRERPFLSFDDDGGDPGSELPASGNVLAEMTQRESLDALHRTIGTLPHAYREVLILCDLEELDYAQAAQTLDCAIGTVRSRLHRARSLLMAKWQTEQRNARSVRCSA
jgi:RNA polymerase sigma-70 factor (ECF subfamily)